MIKEHLDPSPAFLTSDDFIRSNEIMAELLSKQQFYSDDLDLLISLEHKKSRCYAIARQFHQAFPISEEFHGNRRK